MKFVAIAALVATTQAVKLSALNKSQEPDMPSWEEVLEAIDADGSGTISWPELKDFMVEVAKAHDFELTPEMVDEVHEVFKMVDTDGSGDVDKKEFEAAVAAHGALGQRTRKVFAQVKQGPPTWEEILEVLDTDGSGTVSWPEIEDFIAGLEEQHGEKMPKEMKEEIKKVFDMVDTDDSGDIDKAEFEAAMEAHGALGQRTRKAFSQLTSKAKQGPPTWEEVLDALDKDGSGTVSWDEVEAFIKKLEKEHGQKMPEDMKEEIKKVFDAIDTDGSGDIDKAEFEAAIAAHGALGQRTRKAFSQLRAKPKKKKKGLSQLRAKQGPPTWDEILEVLDSDNSGTVSWPEIEDFIAMLEEQHGEKMPKEMKEEIKKVFDMVDTDDSGDIDKAEFEAAVAAHGALGQRSRKVFSQLKNKAQGPPTWEEILEVLDEDDSGTVSWAEIEGFIAEMEKQHGEKLPAEAKKEIKKVFDMVDTDGSGDIDKAEFEAAMAAHGALGQRTRRAFSQLRNRSKAKQGAPSWEQVLELLDQDDSGTVSWDEVVAFVKEWEKQTGEKLSKEDKEMLKKAFEYVDTDGSGDIDKKEFEAAVASMEGLAQIKKMF